MQPADLALITRVSDPQIHPDGRRIAFVVTTIDLGGDRYRSALWLWDGDVRQLTYGSNDSAPRWSPDGRTLAFVRKGNERKDPTQLAVMPSDGGEAQVITDFELGVRGPMWSPDGGLLLVTATEWTSEWAGLDKDERARRPRRITGFDTRLDNRGWLHDRRDYAYVIDPGGGAAPRRVGTSDESESGPVWSPDGAKVALVTSRDNPRSLESGSEVVEVEVDGGAETIRARRSGYYLADYDPQGALHAIGNPEPEYPYVFSLWRLDDPPVDVTGHIDRSIDGFATPSAIDRPIWLDEGFLCGVIDRGRGHVVAFDARGGTRTVLGGDRYITGVSRIRVREAGLHRHRPHLSGRAVRAEPRWRGVLSDRLQPGSSGPASGLVRPGFSTVESAPGVEVDTWVYVPRWRGSVPGAAQHPRRPGFGVRVLLLRRVPDLRLGRLRGGGVQPARLGRARSRLAAGGDRRWLGPGRHGGHHRGCRPGTQDRPAPRSVPGRDHGRFLRGVPDRLGHSPRRPLPLSSGGAGPDRLGVVRGTSDINRDFAGLYLAPATPADHEAQWEASPIAAAGRITTPTLIIHSESDLRCPIGQAEQLFTALLRNGIDTEMIRFPDEGHELSRSGAPRHRVERFEHILAWHARHLGQPGLGKAGT